MLLREVFQKLLVVLSKYNLINQDLPLSQILYVTIFSQGFNTKSEEQFSQSQIYIPHFLRFFVLSF